MKKFTANLLRAIAIMERARENKTFSNLRWQKPLVLNNFVTEEAQLYYSGNTADFGGHIAISPEFVSDGGRMGPLGEPIFEDQDSHRAVSLWLAVDESIARSLCYGNVNENKYSRFYKCQMDEVTPDHVIVKLREIIESETDKRLYKSLKELSKNPA